MGHQRSAAGALVPCACRPPYSLPHVRTYYSRVSRFILQPPTPHASLAHRLLQSTPNTNPCRDMQMHLRTNPNGKTSAHIHGQQRALNTAICNRSVGCVSSFCPLRRYKNAHDGTYGTFTGTLRTCLHKQLHWVRPAPLRRQHPRTTLRRHSAIPALHEDRTWASADSGIG